MGTALEQICKQKQSPATLTSGRILIIGQTLTIVITSGTFDSGDNSLNIGTG